MSMAEYYTDLRRRIRTCEVRSSGASQQPATMVCVCGGKGFLVKYTGAGDIVPELITYVCRREDNLSRLDRSR